MAKIMLAPDENAKRILADRAQRISGPDEYWNNLSPLIKSIHFLRGVQSRAGMALPAFYLFCGSNNIAGLNQTLKPDYPHTILKEYLKFSSLNTITLACRKTFDDGKKGLTGKNFVRWSDQAFSDIAEYWSSSSGRALQDAERAVFLLQTVFRDISLSSGDLLKSNLTLGRRIGLLVRHANRSAAHLSMQRYELDILDCAHVVAALVLIAEIIRSFDVPEQPDHFDSIDIASLTAARQLFPDMPNVRLFQDIKIEAQARWCWQWGIERGRNMMFEQLPEAIGWY